MPDMKKNLISIPQLVDYDCTCQLQKTKTNVQCGDTTLICEQEHEIGLWKIPIENEKNGNGNEKSITATNRIKNFDAGPNKLEHVGMTKNRVRKKKQNRSLQDR